MLSGWRLSYSACSVFVCCLLVLWLQLCGYRGRKARSRKWLGCFPDSPVGPSPRLGRKTVVADMVCSCGGSRGNFCIKRRHRDLELCASQETWHQREEAMEDKGLFVDPVQKKCLRGNQVLKNHCDGIIRKIMNYTCYFARGYLQA